MRKKLLVLLASMLLFSFSIDAAVYYINGESGDDLKDGLSLSTAWKTIHKANQTLDAGDTVLIRGGTYYVGNPTGWPGATTEKQGIEPQNSGIAGNPITYTNYNGEDVQFVGDDDMCSAVMLYTGSMDNPVPHDYIIVKELHFSNFYKFLWILNSSHCEIAYCSFQKTYERPDHVVRWRGSTIYKDAQYNHIHHSTFSEYGNFVNNDDNGVVLEIGNENAAAGDFTSYNLIEDCHIYHSAHHVVGILGNNNVFRNNYIHNENWWEDTNGDKWGNRILYMQSDGSGEGCPYNRRNLVEGNRIAFGGDTAESQVGTQIAGGAISKLSSPYHIIRKNMVYYALTNAIFFQTYHHGNSVYNHIYNNVFYYNGYSTYWEIVGAHSTHAILFNFNQGSSPPCTYEQYGNCIKNNIFYDNCNRQDNTEPITGHCYQGQAIYPPFEYQTIENNWIGEKVGDPKFIYDYSPLDPFGNKPDFRLQEDSPCKDTGGYLTTITSADGSGTQFVVDDAGYFMDGWDIIEGDIIQLEGSAQRAQITNIDYNTDTITVDTSLTWTQGFGVSLVYEGSAPDIGACEYVPTVEDTTPPTDIAEVRDGTGQDIDSVATVAQLSANWDASTDDESDILRYEYAIGDSPGSTGVVGWTGNSTLRSVIRTGLPLTVGVTYYFSVKAINGAELESIPTNSNGQFVIAGGPGGDETPPLILNVNTINITKTGATITWDTDEESTSQVEYGATTSYGNSTSEDSNLVTGHSVELKDLTAGMEYHYRVVSKDSSSNEKISIDYTFKTPGPGGDKIDVKVYPNPYVFKENESITFSISEATGGEVKIYTISGKLVKKLQMGTGESEVNWDVLNEEGNNIKSGLYIYSITDAEGNRKTGKIVISSK
jgi:hypothetical protein